ncbi:MAG: transposase [Syntrophomonadaceae bacterium]
MSRQERIKHAYATYHIIQRGNEQRDIFMSDSDRHLYLNLLRRTKQKYQFLLHAYCLMSNHVHLIINDNGHDISLIMKSLSTSYAVNFNKKHQRVGHLFQGRFRSELVTDDSYLLELSRYIHNNPVKANMVSDPTNYQWSSYNHYIGLTYNELVDEDLILAQFSMQIDQAKNLYRSFVLKDEEADRTFLDIDENEQEINGDRIAIECQRGEQIVMEMAASRQLDVERFLRNRLNRNAAIWELKQQTSLPLKEIGKICGNLSESRVSHILKDEQNKHK